MVGRSESTEIYVMSTVDKYHRFPLQPAAAAT
jgi:hypothetical protein